MLSQASHSRPSPQRVLVLDLLPTTSSPKSTVEWRVPSALALTPRLSACLHTVLPTLRLVNIS